MVDMVSTETIELRSTAFADHAPIPERHSKDGEGLSPPLAWSGVPADTAELAVVCEDPDAPGGTFVHWVLVGINPALNELTDGETPSGAAQGRNDFGEEGYGGPSPPVGDRPHRYVFRIFAASEPLGLNAGVSADDLRKALAGRELATGTLVGTYQR